MNLDKPIFDLDECMYMVNLNYKKYGLKKPFELNDFIDTFEHDLVYAYSKDKSLFFKLYEIARS